jgi:CO dehydrogenase maturation factor
MLIGCIGKGGSGKSTIAALCALRWATSGRCSLAIDADVNQHLAFLLALQPAVTTLAKRLPTLKRHLCGTNPRLSPEMMIKTSPPGQGSRLLHGPRDPALADCTVWSGNLGLLSAGELDSGDLGVRCHHSKSGAVELLLNHLVIGKDDRVMVDMTAGADMLASGLFTRFDLTLAVVEPTWQSVAVYHQYHEHAHAFGLPTVVVGNKIETDDDLAFLRAQIAEPILPIPRLSALKRVEQGETLSLEQIAPVALETIDAALNWPIVRDGKRFTALAHEFHRRNARSWANKAHGIDLEQQIDPSFQWNDAVRSHQEMKVS